MKYALIISLLGLLACNGKLSDEQKRKIKEEMTESKIKKITEAEITEAAFLYGRTITSILEKRDVELKNKNLIDSLQAVYQVEIISMKTDDATLREVEKKIIEAYIAGGNNVSLSDNIQKMGKDSILYTKPLMKKLPDGSVAFSKALGLRIPKKEIIRSIK